MAHTIGIGADKWPAMRPDELSRRLKLDEIAKNHTWKVEPSCATTGEGIFEGLVSAIIIIVSILFTNDSTTPGLAWPECQDSAEIDALCSAIRQRLNPSPC